MQKEAQERRDRKEERRECRRERRETHQMQLMFSFMASALNVYAGNSGPTPGVPTVASLSTGASSSIPPLGQPDGSSSSSDSDDSLGVALARRNKKKAKKRKRNRRDAFSPLVFSLSTDSDDDSVYKTQKMMPAKKDSEKKNN